MYSLVLIKGGGRVINPGREGEYPEGGEPGETNRGTLLNINLTDVLQVLSVNRKTCTLFLRKDEERGEIYLQEGKIIDAKVGELKGEQALFYLLDWEGADFFIGTSIESSINIRIEKDLHSLIVDWIERRDGREKEREVKPAEGEKAGERYGELGENDETIIFLKRLEASGLIRPKQ